MSKRHKRVPGSPQGKASSGVWLLVFGVVAAAIAGLWWTSRPPSTPAAKGTGSTSNIVSGVTSNVLASNDDTNVPTMEVATSVMVTDVLEYGDRVLTPAEAVQLVERQHKPDDGSGRTFAMLEAVGFTNDTGKLQLSMRLSSEEPGLAALVFRPTGKVLWKSRIVPRQGPPPAEKQLTVMMDEEDGKQLLVDGSKSPTSILEAAIHQSPLLMKDHWPNGAERTVTFIYSACGCPVKVKVRRIGDKTVRTSDTPVLFPDDPDALRVINSLMSW
jgi:hypothetical protein